MGIDSWMEILLRQVNRNDNVFDNNNNGACNYTDHKNHSEPHITV